LERLALGTPSEPRLAKVIFPSRCHFDRFFVRLQPPDGRSPAFEIEAKMQESASSKHSGEKGSSAYLPTFLAFGFMLATA
jgi:hypothetical protein